MVFRFGNGIFEPLWNRNHIDHVQITVAEAVGVEGRGKFYESTGALRDMVPNHLFQLLTLVAMEPPTCFAAEAVRSEKAKVLDAVQRYSPQDARQNVVRGQYGGGKVNGRDVDPYRRAPNVAPELEHRDLRGVEADDGQLALGRRADLSAYRQGARQAAQRDRHPIQAGAARLVSRHAGRAPHPQRPGAAHPAGGRRDAAVRRQGPGPRDEDGRRRYEVRLPGLFPRGAAHRLRDADL